MRSVSTPSWRVPAMLCVGLLVFAGIMPTVFPQQNLGFAPGYGSAVLAFEFARTPADLEAVFGPLTDPRVDVVEAMDAGNRIDFGFMLVYGAFVFAFHRAATSLGGPAVAAWLGPLAAACDAVENKILLDITANLAEAPGLSWLRLFVSVKFAALALSAALGGLTLVRTPSRFLRLGGAAALIGSALAVAAVVAPHRLGQALFPGIGVAWMVFAAVSVRHATWR